MGTTVLVVDFLAFRFVSVLSVTYRLLLYIPIGRHSLLVSVSRHNGYYPIEVPNRANSANPPVTDGDWVSEFKYFISVSYNKNNSACYTAGKIDISHKFLIISARDKLVVFTALLSLKFIFIIPHDELV